MYHTILYSGLVEATECAIYPWSAYLLALGRFTSTFRTADTWTRCFLFAFDHPRLSKSDKNRETDAYRRALTVVDFEVLQLAGFKS